jgi:hypothetical protein
MNIIKDFGCPNHGTTYLSIFFDDLHDKLYERCTKDGCEFQREHTERRKEDRRKL